MKPDFAITHDQEFLNHFLDYRDIFKLSPDMVIKLRDSKDPYGIYGYGQWLYNVRPDGDESVKEAMKCFESASGNGVADAKQMLSYMAYIGDSYNEQKGGIWEKCNVTALILNVQAQEEGSLLARLRKNIDLFHGNIIPANREAAIREAEEEASRPGASLLWLEHLGLFYELEERNEEAIKVYEKCVEGGLYYPIFNLALQYYTRGNIAYYESLMEDGIEKGVPACMVWGIENDTVWDELSQEQRDEIHQRMAVNLYKGVELGNNICAYFLASSLFEGSFGFEKNLEEALRIAHKGVSYHDSLCCGLILDIMASEDIEDELPEEMILSDEEYAMVVLKALRYGDTSKLESIVTCCDEFIDMGYGKEMKYWAGKWNEMQKESDETADTAPVEKEEKTEIDPTVLIIHPSGFTDFVEADLNSMSLREIGELIDADGIDAVHFSEQLTRISKVCGLSMNLTMYVDKDGNSKDLDDNAAGTMLYGRGYEIRGAVVVAMEDSRYGIHSFDTEEDIENVYESIDDMTGGLLSRETDEEDGRYDAWA